MIDVQKIISGVKEKAGRRSLIRVLVILVIGAVGFGAMQFFGVKKPVVAVAKVDSVKKDKKSKKNKADSDKVDNSRHQTDVNPIKVDIDRGQTDANHVEVLSNTSKSDGNPVSLEATSDPTKTKIVETDMDSAQSFFECGTRRCDRYHRANKRYSYQSG